jgi:ABC-type dipeptide/oligopeptide/nickel transport system permease component
MKSKLLEHTLSILLVSCAFIALVNVIKDRESSREADRTTSLAPYLRLDSLDLGNPLHAALFKEALDIFHPDTPARNDSLFQAIQSFRQEQFTNQSYKTGGEGRGLSSTKLLKLGTMYVQFIVIYIIVIMLSYYAAQSLGIYRFVKMKQNKTSYLSELHHRMRSASHHDASFYVRSALLLAKALVKGLSYAVLFAPAYVIAYSIRSSIDTDSYLFMIVLGVISNGVLINYANKFFTFLVTESRKGYVQTAIVKNLNGSYAWGTPDGVSYWSVLRPRSLFPSHVFRHIYLNARFQFLNTLKEHASFLITGLIIIEMALNIQGHLGYELLQNILYKQYDVVVSIILGIFFIVKVTEMIVDGWFHHESRKYENKE